MEQWLKLSKKGSRSTFWNTRPISKNKYRSGMPVNLFGDRDKDGVMNVFDCRPTNRRKQGANPLLMVEIQRQVYPNSPPGIKSLKRYRQYTREQLRKTYPEQYEKSIGKTNKVITPYEVVRTLAKNPKLYSEYRKRNVELGQMSVIEAAKEGKASRKAGERLTLARTHPKGIKDKEKAVVVFRPVHPIKQSTKEILIHELPHTNQPKEMLKEQELIEKQIGRKLKYTERPAEIEAFEEQKKLTKELETKEKSKPETLKELDMKGGNNNGEMAKE